MVEIKSQKHFSKIWKGIGPLSASADELSFGEIHSREGLITLESSSEERDGPGITSFLPKATNA